MTSPPVGRSDHPAPDGTAGPGAPAPAESSSAGPAPAAADQAREAPPKQRRRKSLLRRVLGPLISLAIVVAVFFYFIPQFASISDIWTEIQAMTWREITVLVAAALWNLVTYWFVMVATMPGLRYRQAAVVNQTTTAVSNTIPVGSAVGVGVSYAMYDSWGFSRSRSSVGLTVAGVWNNFAKLGMPVVALALLALQATPSTGRLIGALIGLGLLVAAIVVFGMVLHSNEAARRIGLFMQRTVNALLKPFRRGPVQGWDQATTKFRSRTVLLLRARWLWITVATLVSHLSLYLVLLIALRQVGVSEAEVNWIEVLVVFSFARLITAPPITPGALGVIDVLLITGLAAAGGDRAEVAAAVLVYRALTYVLPIPIGVFTYAFWRRNKSWRRAPGTAPRTHLVPESV